MTFRYRVLVHPGGSRTANIAARYDEYAAMMTSRRIPRS